MTCHSIPLGIAGIALILGAGACQRVGVARLSSSPHPLPHDLLLTPEAAAQSSALAHYAWGLKAEMEKLGPGWPEPPPPWVPSPWLVSPFIADSAPWLATPPKLGPLAELEPVSRRHLRAAVDLQPDNAKLLDLFLATVSRTAAPAELERLAARHPDSTPVALALAALREEQGKSGAASDLLWNTAKLKKWRDAELAEELYGLLVSEKRLTEAGDALAFARGPGGLAANTTLLGLAADYHWRCQEPENATWGTTWWHRRQAQALMRQAADQVLAAKKETADDVTLYGTLSLSILLQQAKDDARSEAVLLAAQKLFPESPTQIEFALLDLYISQQRTELALPLLAPLEERLGGQLASWWRYGRDADTAAVLLQDYQELTEYALRLGQQETALRLLLQAVRLQPNSWTMRVQIGDLFLALGDADKALEAVRGIRLAIPGKFWVISRAYAQKGKLPEAVRQAEKAATTARSLEQEEFFTVEFYLGYSFMLEQVGRKQESLSAAETALRLDPASANAANTVGYILAEMNRDLPRAEALIRQALTDDPNDPAVLDSLAWVLYRRGVHDEAWIQISLALEKLGKNEDAVLFEHAGDIAAAAGKPVEALQWWKRALAIHPQQPAELRQKIERLRASQPPSAP